MNRYRIVRGSSYNGCIPITVYWVQVRVDKRFMCEYVNVKGFESYSRAEDLLNYLND
uniref:hypothetical protein n=1 Tax=Candidatus Cryptobacteroides bacterium TaxID=3085639 RepID=UPI004027B388